ncbi:MAG: hypothetical protein U5J97_11640 [Trueperaceae bacterium]|nr:hypothetical protein [Trueperaceae bacterium]
MADSIRVPSNGVPVSSGASFRAANVTSSVTGSAVTRDSSSSAVVSKAAGVAKVVVVIGPASTSGVPLLAQQPDGDGVLDAVKRQSRARADGHAVGVRVGVRHEAHRDVRGEHQGAASGWW